MSLMSFQNLSRTTSSFNNSGITDMSMTKSTNKILDSIEDAICQRVDKSFEGGLLIEPVEGESFDAFKKRVLPLMRNR